MSEETWSDPKLYRELSEPFLSKAEAVAALEKFQEEMAEVRKRNKVANCVLVMSFNWLAEDGEESEALTLISFGDSLKRESLLAYAFGTVQAERESSIAKLVGKGMKAQPK